MPEFRTPNLMFPLCRVRVDTGRPEVTFRSGCRGFLGLVPQPLCMKSYGLLRRANLIVMLSRTRVRSQEPSRVGSVSILLSAELSQALVAASA